MQFHYHGFQESKQEGVGPKNNTAFGGKLKPKKKEKRGGDKGA